jgi:hypothetical protein
MHPCCYITSTNSVPEVGYASRKRPHHTHCRTACRCVRMSIEFARMPLTVIALFPSSSDLRSTMISWYWAAGHVARPCGSSLLHFAHQIEPPRYIVNVKRKIKGFQFNRTPWFIRCLSITRYTDVRELSTQSRDIPSNVYLGWRK